MLTNEEVLQEHVRALIAGDRRALVDGYADDAIMMSAAGPIVGKDAIREVFANRPVPRVREVSIDSMVTHGDYIYITGHWMGSHGGETFGIRDGKIFLQTAYYEPDIS
jgi:ketosteroid isomerase-like protein